MGRTKPSTDARRSGIAAVIAMVLHLGLLLAVRGTGAPEPPSPRASTDSDDHVSIELTASWDPRAGAKRHPHPSATPDTRESGAAVARAGSVGARLLRRAARSVSAPPSTQEGTASGRIEHETSTPEPVPPIRPPVDLGLGGKTRSSVLLSTRGRDTLQRPRKSAGLLREGLAQRDARRGLGPAGAAASAASRAASALGPTRGIAVFDVRTDARGLVTGVTLVGFGSNAGAWSAVARQMATSLRGRRFPQARNSRGSLTRLQVAVGQEAKSAAGAEPTKRGAALGQGSRPARNVARDESTRAIMNGPTPSPTLGTKVVGASSGRRVRVSVLSTRQLGG